VRELVRYADRPALLERRDELDFWPRFMHHNAMGAKYWDRLYTDFPDLQLVVVDGDELVAEVDAIALPVGDELPAGWDEAFERGMTQGEPNVVSLLQISVRPDRRGAGVPELLVEGVRSVASRAGMREVIAPVRPTWKERYPLIPIERYAEWRRSDGTHFDPWLRTHERLGGTIVQAAPASMRFEAPVADWEEWTEMRFPEDGSYVVPGMLATLEIREGVGTHLEPNVWVRHPVR